MFVTKTMSPILRLQIKFTSLKNLSCLLGQSQVFTFDIIFINFLSFFFFTHWYSEFFYYLKLAKYFLYVFFSLFYILLIRDTLKFAISQAISQRVARCVEIKFLSMLNKREQKTVNSDSCLNNYIELKQTIHNWWSHPGLSFYSAFTIFHEWNFSFKIRNQRTLFFPNFFIFLSSSISHRGYIDVDDWCWRPNVLVTSLRCWWPIQDVGDRFNTLRKSPT